MVHVQDYLLQVDNKLTTSRYSVMAYPTPDTSGEQSTSYPIIRLFAEKVPHKSPFAIVFKVCVCIHLGVHVDVDTVITCIYCAVQHTHLIHALYKEERKIVCVCVCVCVCCVRSYLHMYIILSTRWWS